MPSDTPGQTQTLSQKFRWLLVCVGILAAGFIVMNLLQAFAPQPQQIVTAPSIPQVTVWPMEYRGSPLQIGGQGLVQPRAEIGISAQVNGEVIRTHAQLLSGGQLKKGDVLLEIDPRPFHAALEEAAAARQAQAASLELLERQLKRAVSLQERDFVDENTLDDLRSRRDQAAANLRRQEALLQVRELDLEYTRIRAPFNGYVLSESVDVGDIVSPGRELARYYASDSAEVVVALQMSDAAFLPDLWAAGNVRRPAVVQAEYGKSLFAWPAYVDRVEADLDQTTRTIDVVVSIADPQQPGTAVNNDNGNTSISVSPPPLLVGMYVDVIIEGMPLPGHFVLPVSAVHNGHIWTVENGNTLRLVPVQLVRQEEDSYVLLAPELNEGAAIVTSSLALVSDGMQVQVDGANP